ncbi:hypothetical protein MNBD_GAMMA26-36 [hydrothermal vent metagenome]|uniref:SPOR domain-containing protein n=1 Tax=hydrothermal vent metagenome TaxID=652676 RepID=A0A3B1C414_9ZZZZ
MHLIATLFLLLGTAANLSASESAEYLTGKIAADKGNTEKAFQVFTAAAKQGDAWSQYGLGVLLRSKQGTKQDHAAATQWLQKAAAQGHNFAQFNLGNAYVNGLGIEPDPKQAAKWWQQAAEQGNRMAQNNLGTLLYFYFATNPSKRLGKAWLEAAASQGDQEAEMRLTEITSNTKNKVSSAWLSEPERSEVRILVSNPERYAINLFSAKLKSSITRFINQNDLAGRAFVYRFSRNNTTWYGVLLSSYVDKKSAKKAIANMSPELAKYGPWAILISTVHDRIHTVQSQKSLNNDKPCRQLHCNPSVNMKLDYGKFDVH